MGIFSFSSKRVNKKDHLGKRQSLIWSITLAGYRRQVGDLVQTQKGMPELTFPPYAYLVLADSRHAYQKGFTQYPIPIEM